MIIFSRTAGDTSRLTGGKANGLALPVRSLTAATLQTATDFVWP
ncbi:MAG: hypothetical protein AAFY02_20685 [Pseudomonadota bacterium]